MKALKVFFALILTLFLLFVIGYAYYGGFSNINFQISKQGGEKLVYKDVIGNYEQCGDVINKLMYSLQKNDNIITIRSFGIYYDDPLRVNVSKLRSQVGCILENSDTSKIFWLKDKYNIKTFPIKKYITCVFPYKGHISIMISLLRVKPALNRYLKDNGYGVNAAVMEIYDLPQQQINYRVEITPKLN
ncbi:MAG: GyrI-like domain-containing protein [Paludibacter sp.]